MDIKDFKPEAQEYITKLRAEAAKHRTRAVSAETSLAEMGETVGQLETSLETQKKNAAQLAEDNKRLSSIAEKHTARVDADIAKLSEKVGADRIKGIANFDTLPAETRLTMLQALATVPTPEPTPPAGDKEKADPTPEPDTKADAKTPPPPIKPAPETQDQRTQTQKIQDIRNDSTLSTPEKLAALRALRKS